MENTSYVFIERFPFVSYTAKILGQSSSD